MNIIENYEKLERIKELARRKATGPPKELSDKLNVSERNLFRMISYLRYFGLDIFYSRRQGSYMLRESSTSYDEQGTVDDAGLHQTEFYEK